MNKIIETVDAERGIKRVTTVDERWYIKDSTNDITGLPEYRFVPSVTWIAGKYPKGVAFYKWLANKGWDESEAIKEAAGSRGSKIHLAVADLLNKKVVSIESKYKNPETGVEEILTLEEYDAIRSFRDWFLEVKPEVLKFEYVVWDDDFGYAGTVDLKCKIGNEVWLIDLKTGQNIWPEYELQVSAYGQCEPDVQKLGVLQVGYKRNKWGWKLTEVEDKFQLFLAAKQIWANEHAGEQPSQKDYPLELTLVTEESKVVAPKKSTKNKDA